MQNKKRDVKYGSFMTDLTEICQQVWIQTDLETKRNLLLRACDTFKYKEQGMSVRRAVEKSKSCTELDKIAGNLILNKTDKVVGLLKR